MTIEAYQVDQSSESGRERITPPIPWARLLDVTPTLKDPACVNGRQETNRICGTVWNAGVTTTDETVLLNVAEGRLEHHEVRNVLTYTAGPVAEATWGAINIGDAVYYDEEQDTLNGIKLSTAPLQSDAATYNPFFGYVVPHQDEDADDFAKGEDGVASTQECTILCAGLNTAWGA